MPRPDDATLKGFVASLENTLDASYRARVNPGRSPVHRLNRAEYRNAIRELLAIDVDVDQWLPADDTSYGFDNISDILRISPLLVSRYLTAAEKISAVAVGDPEIVAGDQDLEDPVRYLTGPACARDASRDDRRHQV